MTDRIDNRIPEYREAVAHIVSDPFAADMLAAVPGAAGWLSYEAARRHREYAEAHYYSCVGCGLLLIDPETMRPYDKAQRVFCTFCGTHGGGADAT
jgi:hypothetical protein